MYEYRKKGKHITPDERAKIEILYRQGKTQNQIAQEVGVSQQAISKELRKGGTTQLNGATWEYYTTYTADTAQRITDYNKSAHSNGLKVGNDYAYLQALADYIQLGYSPYAAIGKVAETKNFEIHLSKTTLYRYIQEGLLPNVDYRKLPVGHPKKRNHKVTRIRRNHPCHRSIEQRLPEILARNQVGHWEMDSIIGKAKGKRESCLVLTERKTRVEIVLKVRDKTAQETTRALGWLKRYFGKDYKQIFKTITCDNGTEFSDQLGMDKTGTTVFYCHPQAPHERGSNEVANKLVRRMFPKGQSMAMKNQQYATQAQHFVNHYPREMWQGKTAAQKLAEELPNLHLQNPDKIRIFFKLQA